MKKNKFEFIIDSEFQSQIPACRKLKKPVRHLLREHELSFKKRLVFFLIVSILITKIVSRKVLVL